GLFSFDGQNGNNSFESDEEIIFKHAIYFSNQYKNNYLKTLPYYPTLMHKIIHVPQVDQLKTVKQICKDMNGNIIALIDPSIETLNIYSRSLCEQLDLIHIDIEPNLEPSYSFNLYPALDVICQAFADLIKKFDWKHAAIIYNSKTNLETVNCLLSGPANSMPKLDIAMRMANYEYEYRSILRDISGRSIKNIIIDLEPDQTQTLLKMALQLGMVNSTFSYIVTSLDAEIMNLEDFKYNRANITALRIVKPDSDFHRLISLNLTDYLLYNSKDNEKNKILLKTKNALLFDSIFTIAIAIKEAEQFINLNLGNVSCTNSHSLTFGGKLSSFVERVSLNGLTGLIKFQNKQRREFELDVLQLKEIGLYKCGSWSPDKGLNFTFFDEVFEENGLGQRKNSFRVVTLVEEPYVIEKDGKLQGFCIDILDEIANKMNFRYEIYKAADNQYGNEENGTWNGMIKELMDKKADLAISAFTINYKRQQMVDFTKPFLSLGISILYKVPTSKKPGLFSFLNPLSLEIWMFTLITYLLVSLIMMVLARFSPYEWRSTHPCDSNNEFVENQFTVWNSLWFAVGTLMQQGSDINPKALSTRLVGGVWWFFTLIIISSYTANLAAFLTVEKVDLSITNVEDLANQTKISYGVFKGGSTMNFFKDSKIETYQRMWKEMIKNPDKSFVKSNQEGIERVLKKDYAYLMESPLIDYEIQRNCNLTQIGGLLDSKGYGIATQLGSPYTDDISLKILEMQEKGDIQKFYNRWWKSGSTCIRDEKKDSKANPLKVENVGGIFVVLVGGCLLAVFVSFLEFIYYAKTNSKYIKKPICTQMIDELRFAVKCGGSAKKIQLSTTTAVPVKSPSKQQLQETTGFNEKNLSRSLGNLDKKECKKCEKIIQNELIDNIKSDNALVCKHNSKSNLSIRNPGLLIVEREAAIDAQTALLNSHATPYSHLHLSHQQVNHERKPKKSKSRKKTLPNYELKDDSDEFFQLKTFNRNPDLMNNDQRQNDRNQFGILSKNSQINRNISISKDQYEIPIIRLNENSSKRQSQAASSFNRDKSLTNLSSSSSYQIGNHNFR
ncbi:unnamed protein product, partial [Brachionus calyciflorus]